MRQNLIYCTVNFKTDQLHFLSKVNKYYISLGLLAYGSRKLQTMVSNPKPLKTLFHDKYHTVIFGFLSIYRSSLKMFVARSQFSNKGLRYLVYKSFISFNMNNLKYMQVLITFCILTKVEALPLFSCIQLLVFLLSLPEEAEKTNREA